MDRPTFEHSDVIDPADEDWTRVPDSRVYSAARAGIREAIIERDRRDQLDRPPMGNCCVIPSEEDWTRNTDSTVYDASIAGIPEAVIERVRRNSPGARVSQP